MLYNENCLKTMENMSDNSVDLVVTSPPYDNLRSYNGYNFDFEPIARELFRVIKQGGVVVWVVGDQTIKGSESGTSFRQALFFKEIGLNLHDTMIFGKNNPFIKNHSRYEQAFEYMFIFSKGSPKTFNPMREPCKTAGRIYTMKRPQKQDPMMAKRVRDCQIKTSDTKIKGNVWFYNIGNSKTTGHVAGFPEQLAADHIISWSNEGDLVYDPFFGSGTTAVAAIKNKRRWIGSEISEEYCDLIRRRINNA